MVGHMYQKVSIDPLVDIPKHRGFGFQMGFCWLNFDTSYVSLMHHQSISLYPFFDNKNSIAISKTVFSLLVLNNLIMMILINRPENPSTPKIRLIEFLASRFS